MKKTQQGNLSGIICTVGEISSVIYPHFLQIVFAKNKKKEDVKYFLVFRKSAFRAPLRDLFVCALQLNYVGYGQYKEPP